MIVTDNYIQSAKKQFEYYKLLGERTFAQLRDDDLFWQYLPESNSIAIVVNHLYGNMRSRWTDFLDSDGEKEWRKRDMEFEAVITTRPEMMEKWNGGWRCLFSALDSVHNENINQAVFIRNQSHTIVEAVNRQMMHYAYHIGQIVYIGRMIRGSNWKSLSIPKGESNTFNREKFSKGTHHGHFTDDFKSS